MQDDAIRAARVYPSFIPVTGLKCSYGEISSPLTEDLGWKNPDLGNRATPPSHIKISSKILHSNSGKARKPGSCEEALIWLTKPGLSSAEKTPQSLHCSSSNCLLPASRLVTVPFSALGMIRSIYRNSLFFHTAT